MTCQHGTRRAGGQKCEECWLRSQPIETRQKAARLRALAIPKPLHKERIPAAAWPAGRRWCAGCQTFVLLKDCGKTASRCRTCVSVSAHAGMIQRTYMIKDSDGTIRPFTSDDYDRLYRLQAGRCYLCRRASHTKRLAVDHNHKTNLVRGLLCPGDMGCNFAIIGRIEQDPDPIAMVQRIMDYFTNPPAER
jgi:hypothetical protein